MAARRKKEGKKLADRKPVWELDKLLKRVRELREQLARRRERLGALPSNVMVVEELPAEEVHKRIHEVARQLYEQIEETGRPVLEIPARTSDNIIYDEDHDLLLLGQKRIRRVFHSLASVADATRTIRILEIIHELIEEGIHATKREIFYNDVKLFKEQRFSDHVIEDIAAMLGTTRNSTHVVAAAKGAAIGRLIIRDSGDVIDLTKLGSGGWAITPFLDQVEILESDAELVLVVEKDAALIRLAEAKYWNKLPCIIITGKGSADIATRAFLRKLVKELKIPAFALVDSDPYGHYIFSVYLRGSKKLSYESPFLATPEIKLLGVLSKDLDEFKIPKEVRLPMTKADIERTEQLLKEPFVQRNKKWVKDLELMLERKEKAEIQALASHGFKYLTDQYLPIKIETGDWI
ncbi:MAG: DNA topoisomerase IV subunit A [Candidatus Baldrarchaeia archaeon]